MGPSRVTTTQSRGASVRRAIRHVDEQDDEGQPHRGCTELALRLQRAEEHLLEAGFTEPEPVGVEGDHRREEDGRQDHRSDDEHST